MPTDREGLPTLFHPADVAKVLGKSEWWVKEQARRGRIPFTKPGRAYRFTEEQIVEIVRMFESRPLVARPRGQERPAAPIPQPPERRATLQRTTVQLRARTPRRVEQALKAQVQAA
ncbi:helix-turn-helix domain-containing protein [Kitasatospora kifunensis]|uniref:Excisionase family DNA binding protein n=1 Tax=Kitasatospora kifunensis TaxID=58351 RepID=A0A7W7VVV5_KITKI|nr:helix-turn-helix domain-containing protein [Kitasatospora kifunensis]MBB4924792.1 excisionase family DNA binding protein [Kitasatospora kifunensis]